MFALAPSLHSFWISCTILSTCWPGEFISVSYLFAFSYCSWGSQGKNTEVVCHSLLQWTTFCQNSPPWPIHLGWPHTTWLFHWVRQGWGSCDHDWLVFCDYGFSLSALWCPPSVPTILLGFSCSGREVFLPGCSKAGAGQWLHGCWCSSYAYALERLRLDTLCPRSGAAAKRIYPTSKVRSSGREEIPFNSC